MASESVGAVYSYGAAKRILSSEFNGLIVQVTQAGYVRIDGSLIYVLPGTFIDMRVKTSIELVDANSVTFIDPEALRGIHAYDSLGSRGSGQLVSPIRDPLNFFGESAGISPLQR